LEQKKEKKNKKTKKEEEFFCVKFEKFCGLFSSFSLRDVNSFCFLLFFFLLFFLPVGLVCPSQKNLNSLFSLKSLFSHVTFLKKIYALLLLLLRFFCGERVRAGHTKETR
jgi:hypothetical protein